MIGFARSDTSILARWWWTVDRWLLIAIALLLGMGFLLTLAASPPVADRLGLASFHFAVRQAVFLCLAVAVMLGLSLLSTTAVRRVACVLFPLCLVLVVMTLFLGREINGATRWLHLGMFTLQPSELLKPAFVVLTAWMCSEEIGDPAFPGKPVSLALYLIVVTFLVMQPDFGQAILITVVWLGQLAMAGLSMTWIGAAAAAGIAAIVLAYLTVPHVASRIDRFFDPSSGDTYQIDTALNAFRAGGLFGRGPGEGAVKKVLPDAHTDYIFAVAGEEFGAFVCLAIVALFAVIVVRGLAHLVEEENPFVLLAASGLLALFGLQALINIGVNLALVPSKGMTLPFISYGGSSMLALAVTMGMVLALTRRNRFATGRSRLSWGAS